MDIRRRRAPGRQVHAQRSCAERARHENEQAPKTRKGAGASGEMAATEGVSRSLAGCLPGPCHAPHSPPVTVLRVVRVHVFSLGPCRWADSQGGEGRSQRTRRMRPARPRRSAEPPVPTGAISFWNHCSP